jgi:Patatin-like phospholipase
MTSYPLSLTEVLREEFCYFFPGLVPADANIDEKDVRQLADLARRLPLLAEREPQTRWKILYERARAMETNDDDGNPDHISGRAIVGALRSMLVPQLESGTKDGWLLDRLMEDVTVRPLIEATEKLHELLQIRVARRLLLERPELAERILSDEKLVRDFHLRSGAIRLLDAEGFRPAFKRYPALLSIIGDDRDLEHALGVDEGAKKRREQLITTYAKEDPHSFFTKIRQKLGLKPKLRIDERHELTPSATTLKELFGLQQPTDSNRVEHDAIPRGPLSQFNAMLLELAYHDHLAGGHRLRGLYDAVRDRDLAALCLSGGGIRSATFNLGVLQGLADHRLLTRFHYVSTVSGGGYIGSWLSSWIRRHSEGATGVAKDLSRAPIDPAKPEVEPIQHLRKYTSYLAPAAGALSIDTWTLVATYFRNLLLNWTMFLPLLVAVLLVPRAIEAAAAKDLPDWWIAIAAAIGALALVGVACARPASDITAKQSAEEGEALRKQRRRSMLWLLPLLVAGVLFTVSWPAHRDLLAAGRLMKWVGGASALSALVYSIRRALKNAPNPGWRMVKALFGWKTFLKRALVESVAAGVAGGAAGWLLATLFLGLFGGLSTNDAMAMARYVCFAPPLFLFCFFAEATLIVGLSTYSTSDHDREWWARSAALLFIVGVTHAVVALCILVLPHGFVRFPRIWASAGGFSGIVTWALTKLMNRKKKNNGAAPSRLLGIALKAAAPVTLLLLIAAISLATTALLGKYCGYSPSQHLVLLLSTPLSLIGIVFASSVIVSFIMSRLLNVNVYSMHRMYRNRLVRAYLGASRWDRHPDAFTGFDPEDDLPMWQLRPEALWRSSFVSLDAFINGVPRQRWFSQLDDQLRACVIQCAASTDPDEREELKTAVLEGLNALMLIRDIERDVPAPRGSPTLRMNREFLESCFPQELKNWYAPVPPSGASDALDASESAMYDGTADNPPTDDPRTEAQIATQRVRNRLLEAVEKPAEPFARTPIHVANIALNLVGGDNLAWQERKADTFTVSSLHAGNHRLGYRDSSEYGGKDGISLGDAMAISGAAVSPNMGYNSSPIVTFLMTLFNARLGWWLGNPGQAGNDTHERDSPRSTLPYLVDEALGATTDSDPYVFLSDGGHFDNLGLFEMVLRRCKYIVVCDATADGSYGFGDLGNAVRKIRIDLGIPIELTTKHIRAQAGESAGRYCAAGTILYPEVDGYANPIDYQSRCGRLLYIKPAVYDDCPPDVRNYRSEHNDFPHQSTVDQFFNESQFESYRALGRHAVGRMCRYTTLPQYGTPTWKAPNLPAFFFRAFNYIHEAMPSPGDRPIATIRNVVEWMNSGLSGDM